MQDNIVYSKVTTYFDENAKESILNNKFSQIKNNELEELYNQIKTP